MDMIIKTRAFTVLVLLTLIFSLTPQLSILAFGGESNSEPCWPMVKTYKQNLSANSEAWRNYSLPPAWSDFDSKQEELPINQDLKLALQTDNPRVLNERVS